MKKLFMLFSVALMLGMAMQTMAQQKKKAPVKRTATVTKSGTTAKKATGNTTATSISFEGPAIVNGHLAFMGIPLNENPATMKSKLIAKGFISRQVDEEYSLAVQGTVEGAKARIEIAVTPHNTIGYLNLYEDRAYLLPKAKARYATLVSKLEKIYGKGEYHCNDDDHKIYWIKMEGGRVAVELFNMDEMDGASDYYIVAVSFSENF